MILLQLEKHNINLVKLMFQDDQKCVCDEWVWQEQEAYGFLIAFATFTQTWKKQFEWSKKPSTH